MQMNDHTAAVLAAIHAAACEALSDCGAVLLEEIRRKSRVDTGQTRESYAYQVASDDDSARVLIGSGDENAIYEEYGTGIYALHGDGRKDGWVYRDRKGNFYHTRGKRAARPMARAVEEQYDNLIDLVKGRI